MRGDDAGCRTRDQRLAATREDVIAMAAPVLRHRILLSFAAEAEQKTTDDVVVALLRDVPFAA